jgi:hypothetical protein
VGDASQFGGGDYGVSDCTALLLVDVLNILGFLLAFYRLYEIYDLPRSNAAWSFRRSGVELLLTALCIVNTVLPLVFFNDKDDDFLGTDEDE